ncbi:MAG: carboxypeptidase regulatory-like domain-containing protein, partial [Arthrobacter sp.]|nr:carboxypeptidase regulatory-like domain-containing protein [Arthrobacter sp.]
ARPMGGISGRVAVPSGLDVTKTTILLMRESDDGQTKYETSTLADSSGAYSFQYLTSGRYKIFFRNSTAVESWNGTGLDGADREHAPWIEVGEDQAVTGIDIRLKSPATVSGYVAFPPGARPPGSGWVEAYREGSVEQKGTGGSIELSGKYTILGLPPGSYKLKFVASQYMYDPLWSGGSLTRENATSFVVPEGGVVLGQDASFAWESNSASVSGTLTSADGGSAEGISVGVYRIKPGNWSGIGEFAASAKAGPDGRYTVPDLHTGVYKVAAWTSLVTGGRFWYGGSNEAGAAIVEVKTGTAVTDINMKLPAGASISGSVSGYSGVGDLRVEVYSASNTNPRSGGVLRYATVNPDGTYSVSGIPAGPVIARLFGEAAGKANQWYGGTMASATKLNMVVGKNVSGINFSSVPEAAITGHVKAPLKLESTSVNVFNSAGQEVGDALSAKDGSYTVRGLMPGTYTVRFGPGTPYYPFHWYGGAQNKSGASGVTLVTGQVVAGIDSNVIIVKPVPTLSPTGGTPQPSSPVPTASGTSSSGPGGSATSMRGAGTGQTPWGDPNSGGLAVTGASATMSVVVIAGGVLSALGIALMLILKRRRARH